MDKLPVWLSTFGVIFAIVDPFGYVPVFIAMTKQDTDEKRREMLKRACLAAFVMMGVFTLIGNFLLSFFGISVAALQISGGLILLVIGFDMIRVLPVAAKISEEEESEGSRKEDISIVPLAIPMLSGPASLATVAVLASKAEDTLDYVAILVSIFLTLGITYLTLRKAGAILRRIGVTGLHVLTRVMGLLLCAMAVQFIINGYKGI